MELLEFEFAGESSLTYGATGSFVVPALPERRKNTMPIAGRDGEFDFGRNNYLSLYVSGECAIEVHDGLTLEQAVAAAAAWLSGIGPLVLGRSPEKRWPNAKIYQTSEPEYFGERAFLPIMFECNPPFLEDITPRTGAIGTAQDYGSPLPFAPVITVTMSEAATYLQVQHLESGRFIRLQSMPGLPLALAVDDEVIIDIGAGMVTRNGVSVKANISLASLFFMVPRGEQTILLTTDGTADAIMEYRRRWLYA